MAENKWIAGVRPLLRTSRGPLVYAKKSVPSYLLDLPFSSIWQPTHFPTLLMIEFRWIRFATKPSCRKWVQNVKHLRVFFSPWIVSWRRSIQLVKPSCQAPLLSQALIRAVPAQLSKNLNHTVDGRNPANQLVVYPIIYRVLYIPGGAGFLPSTVL